MIDAGYCCRCFGCDDHDHVCNLALEVAERYRHAHDEAIGGMLRELYEEGVIDFDEDGTLKLSTGG